MIGEYSYFLHIKNIEHNFLQFLFEADVYQSFFLQLFAYV